MALSHIGFLIPGNYAIGDPRKGLEDTLDTIAFAETLGFDSAWVRQRHLEPGISSAAVFLAAATQRTERIALGIAVIQMGYESPFRLAEDLSTLDVLSHGRLNVGLSSGPPPQGELLTPWLFDGDWSGQDFSHHRIARLRHCLESADLSEGASEVETPHGTYLPRVYPVAQGLNQRLWYGGGSLRSAEWAARNGYHFLTGNLNSGEKTDDFYEAQLSHLAVFREHSKSHPQARIALGRVIVPYPAGDTDRRARYEAYGAARHARTLAPQGPRRTLFRRDIIGTPDAVVEELLADPAVAEISELRLELPYGFSTDDYRQILETFRYEIAPHLGWQPA